MRRRQFNQMRAATAPDEAHPTSPVEQSQQAPAVSVPPAPPGPLLAEWDRDRLTPGAFPALDAIYGLSKRKRRGKHG